MHIHTEAFAMPQLRCDEGRLAMQSKVPLMHVHTSGLQRSGCIATEVVRIRVDAGGMYA